MDYKISVYGDSIAYGYGSNNKSWFDGLTAFKNKIKNAQNGETTSNVLDKLIKDTNTYDIIIIAVGINDLLQESRKAEDFVNIKLMAQYNQILTIAKTKADKIIIQSVLPVIENRFPNHNEIGVFYKDDKEVIRTTGEVSEEELLKIIEEVGGSNE